MAHITFALRNGKGAVVGEARQITVVVPSSVAEILRSTARERGVSVPEMMGSFCPRPQAARRLAAARVRAQIQVNGKPVSWSQMARWFGRAAGTTMQDYCGAHPPDRHKVKHRRRRTVPQGEINDVAARFVGAIIICRASRRSIGGASNRTYRPTPVTVTLDLLTSPFRWEPLSTTRQAFMAAASDAGFTQSEIGRFLGRDHKTVAHGIRAHRDRERRGRKAA